MKSARKSLDVLQFFGHPLPQALPSLTYLVLFFYHVASSSVYRVPNQFLTPWRYIPLVTKTNKKIGDRITANTRQTTENLSHWMWSKDE